MSRIGDFFRAVRNPYEPTSLERFNTYGWDDYWSMVEFNFNGQTYNPQFAHSWNAKKQEEPNSAFIDYVRAIYKRDGIVFACIEARRLVFSEVEFKWQRRSTGELFGAPSLLPLERPAENQTTGELLSRMEQDASLAGNWYGYKRPDGTIRRMRPDWVTIVVGSQQNPSEAAWQLDAEVLGYVYKPGGKGSDSPPQFLPKELVAHYSPLPDPDAEFRGMSWLTPVIREVLGDMAATDHKLTFFENAGTPNYVVKAPESIVSPEKFNEFREAIEHSSVGTRNAYRTLYLMAGADVTPLGLDLRQLDFKAVQGAGETRIAAAGGVPAVILGISEGLAGSSLNAGNYGMARRKMSDVYARPHWRMGCACLEKFVGPPDEGSRLWYDPSNVSFLHEDAKDDADIFNMLAAGMRQLVDAGYDPDKVTEAAKLKRLDLLKHTGLFSVQLQPPGTTQPKASPDSAAQENANGNGNKPVTA